MNKTILKRFNVLDVELNIPPDGEPGSMLASWAPDVGVAAPYPFMVGAELGTGAAAPVPPPYEPPLDEWGVEALEQ